MAVSFRSCSFVGIHPQLAAAVLSRKRPHLFSIAFAVSINHLDVSFSYGVSNKALEFQKDRILQATEMSCGCVVLREMEDEEETKSKSGSLKWRIFPFYAMESLKLNANSRKVISDFESSADPIWDSIRAEAKSEGYHSLQSYRVAHALWNQGRKILALALQSRISEVFAVDIHPGSSTMELEE